jgi:hypothetical protein
MSSDAFKALAESLMEPDDAALLGQLHLDPAPVGVDEDSAGTDAHAYAEPARSTGCGFIDHWRDWERALRLNAARRRSVKTRRENAAPVEPPAFPVDAAVAAAKAVAGTESPLDEEILIDKARWSAVEGFAGGEYFDRNTVFAYYLKLVLLERRASFKTEEGLAEYKSLYASILESAQYPAGESK